MAKIEELEEGFLRYKGELYQLVSVVDWILERNSETIKRLNETISQKDKIIASEEAEIRNLDCLNLLLRQALKSNQANEVERDEGEAITPPNLYAAQ